MVLLLEEGNEAGVLYQVWIRLNVQVLHDEPELVYVLACEEWCTREVEEDTLFFSAGFIWAHLFGFGQIHKKSEIFMEERLFNMVVTRDPLFLYQDIRGVYDLVLETNPSSREYFLDGFWDGCQVGD